MRVLFVLVLVVLAGFSMADEFKKVGLLKCYVGNGETSVMESGGGMDDYWGHCQDSMVTGEVCFEGPRKQVIELMGDLNDGDFLGDEYEMVDIHYVGKKQLSYKVYDKSNEWIVRKNRISNCSDVQF